MYAASAQVRRVELGGMPNRWEHLQYGSGGQPGEFVDEQRGKLRRSGGDQLAADVGMACDSFCCAADFAGRCGKADQRLPGKRLDREHGKLGGMEFKALTWNIGGGKLLQGGADPLRIAAYTEDGLDTIARLLKSEEPDVIALQETQRKEGYDQAELIAGSLGYEHYFHDSTSESHIDTDCRLGHCVISRYPISQHRFGLFENPNAQVTWGDGSTAMTHDKGFSSCVVSIGDTQIEVATLHLIPFRMFKIELESRTAQGILQDVAGKLVPTRDKALIQGDFNIDCSGVQPYLGQMFARAGLAEVAIDEPTTPGGRRLDHVLYRGLALKSKRIVSGVGTDHYPVIATFEVR